MSAELVVVPNDAGVSHVRLAGRLDMVALKGLDVQFEGEVAARDRSAIVDVSGLEFITSIGIGMLFGCAKSLRRKGHTMVLLGSYGFVDAALRTVGVHEVVPFAATLEEALQLARGARP